MAATYEHLHSYTLGSGTATTITLGSGGTISQNYTDLRIVLNYNMQTSNQAIFVYFNSDTNSTNYGFRQQAGGHNSTSATNYRDSNRAFFSWWLGTYAGQGGIAIMDVMDYSSTNKKKTSLVFSGNGGDDAGSYDFTENLVGIWRSTSAITSVSFESSSAVFTAGTTINIYGIKAA